MELTSENDGSPYSLLLKKEKENEYSDCNIKTEVIDEYVGEKSMWNQQDRKNDYINASQEYKHFKFVKNERLFFKNEEDISGGKIKLINDAHTKEEKESKIPVNVENYEFLKNEELILKEEDIDVDDPLEEDDPDFYTFQTHYAVVNDNPVSIGTPDRASQTVPKGVLELRPSPVNNLSVYALIDLQNGVRFGPYEGKLTRVESTEGYSWKLDKGRLADESDETDSNYLRYINSAGNTSEQNLVAFQCDGKLYFRTSRDVQMGEELLIYFDNNPNGVYYRPPEQELEEQIYTCQYCHIGMKAEEYRNSHEQCCRFRNDEDNSQSEAQKRGSQTKLMTVMKNFACDPCNFSTNRNGGKIFQHQQKIMLKCKDCQYQTKYRSNLREHRLAKHENKCVFKCRECGFETNTKTYLNRHKLTRHERNEIFKCSQCGYETFNKYRMVDHIKFKHEEADLFRCSAPDCDYMCKYKNGLDRHRNLKHEKKNVYKCAVVDCSYVTYDKTYMKRHQIRHEQKKPMRTPKHEENNLLKCTSPGCYYVSKYKNSLVRHRNLKHEKKNPLKCAVANCRYVTYDKTYMKRHKIRHEQKSKTCDKSL